MTVMEFIEVIDIISGSLFDKMEELKHRHQEKYKERQLEGNSLQKDWDKVINLWVRDVLNNNPDIDWINIGNAEDFYAVAFSCRSNGNVYHGLVRVA